jgi:hypothetical protein
MAHTGKLRENYFSLIQESNAQMSFSYAFLSLKDVDTIAFFGDSVLKALVFWHF